jgi:hypothetical protein
MLCEQIHGSGTTNPSKYLWDVFDRLFALSPRPVKMSYDATGSTIGKINFRNNNLFNRYALWRLLVFWG